MLIPIISQGSYQHVDGKKPTLDVASVEVPDSMIITQSEDLKMDARMIRTEFVIKGVKHRHAMYLPNDVIYSSKLTPAGLVEHVAKQFVDEMIGAGLIAESAKDWMMVRWISVFKGVKYPAVTDEINVVIGGKKPYTISYEAEKAFHNGEGVETVVETKARKLPGMANMVSCPLCTETAYNASLYRVVMHLNDKHHMPREEIADWMDELHDAGKINIEFSPWNEEVQEPAIAQPEQIYKLSDQWQPLGWTTDPPVLNAAHSEDTIVDKKDAMTYAYKALAELSIKSDKLDISLKDIGGIA